MGKKKQLKKAKITLSRPTKKPTVVVEARTVPPPPARPKGSTASKSRKK